jgi:hypothetical protein
MERVQGTLLSVDRIRAIQEKLAGFLVREVIAPNGEYHLEFVFRH